MKLSNVLVAAAMVVGSASAMGCNAVQSAVEANGTATDASDEAADGFYARERFSFGTRYGVREHFSVGTRYGYARSYVGPRYNYGYSYGYARRGYYSPVFVRYAPPRARYEYIGRAPSSRHFWVNGHYHWTGHDYAWVGGHWDMRRNGYTYVQPHYDVINGQNRFIPGHWA